MCQLEHNVIRMQAIQEIEKRRPMALLNCLAAIVAEAKVNRTLDLDRVEYPIDRFRR